MRTYLFYLFSAKIIDLSAENKAFGKSLNSDYLKNSIRIPLPPPEIQDDIISKCESIDMEYERSRMSIESYREKIVNLFNDMEVPVVAFLTNLPLLSLCII